MANLLSTSQLLCEVQSFSIKSKNVRGSLVRLGRVYEEILKNHNYPIQVATLIGELTLISISLSNTLKYKGQFILQTNSDGPINMMVSHVTSDGKVRSYARYKSISVDDMEDQSLTSHLLGNGHITFTVDQGKNTERYQGITALEGSNLAECAQIYFKKSEQIETTIQLIADPKKKNAAALMIQKIPDSIRNIDPAHYLSHKKAYEGWLNLVALTGTISIDDLLNNKLSTHELLHRHYHETDVHIYNAKPLKFHCTCSSERIGVTLASFPEKEIDKMKTKQGLITADCEFCGTQYSFDNEQLRNIRINNQCP